MALNLIIESAEEPGKQLQQSSGDPISAGRDETNLIVVPGTAASRHHGFFLFAEFCWTYWDNKSTNGSLLNSQVLRPGQHVIVRDGDLVKLADYTVVCRVSGDAIPGQSAFLVFSDDGFVRSFSLGEREARYSVGGAGANLNLNLTTPGLVFENSARGLVVIPDPGSSVSVNGTSIEEPSPLVDQDEVFIGGYSILVFDENSIGVPSAVKSSFAAAALSAATSDFEASDLPVAAQRPTDPQDSTGDGWTSEAKRRKSASGKKFVFGSDVDDFDPAATVKVPSYSGGRAGTMEVSVSQRFARAAASSSSSSEEQTETLLAVFGVFVFLCIIAFVAYFLQALL